MRPIGRPRCNQLSTYFRDAYPCRVTVPVFSGVRDRSLRGWAERRGRLVGEPGRGDRGRLLAAAPFGSGAGPRRSPCRSTLPSGSWEGMAVSDASDRPAYSIAAVSKLTGVSCHSLRVWERRYGFPVPRRSAARHRRYSAEQVQTLRHLARSVQNGCAIGAAIAALRADRPGVVATVVEGPPPGPDEP